VLVSVLFAATGSGLALTSSVFQFVSGTLADLLLTVGLFVFTVIVGWLLRGEALAKFRAGTDRFECGARPCF
jgi:NSS family neurotransmitter:Na+ symporter